MNAARLRALLLAAAAPALAAPGCGPASPARKPPPAPSPSVAAPQRVIPERFEAARGPDFPPPPTTATAVSPGPTGDPPEIAASPREIEVASRACSINPGSGRGEVACKPIKFKQPADSATPCTTDKQCPEDEMCTQTRPGAGAVCKHPPAGEPCRASADCPEGASCLLGKNGGRCLLDACGQGCAAGTTCSAQYTKTIQQENPQAPAGAPQLESLACFPARGARHERPHAARSPCDREPTEVCTLEGGKWVCPVFISKHPCGRPLLVGHQTRAARLRLARASWAEGAEARPRAARPTGERGGPREGRPAAARLGALLLAAASPALVVAGCGPASSSPNAPPASLTARIAALAGPPREEVTGVACSPIAGSARGEVSCEPLQVLRRVDSNAACYSPGASCPDGETCTHAATGGRYACRVQHPPNNRCDSNLDCTADEGCLVEPGSGPGGGRCLPSECAKGCGPGLRCGLQYTRALREFDLPAGMKPTTSDTLTALSCFPEAANRRERPYSMRSACDRGGTDVCSLEGGKWVCPVFVSMHPCGRPLLVGALARTAPQASGNAWS